ncbi:hypothetical protein [Brucella pseudogrignonensis]|uniref:hypothetical protein n=1 Tax=Brucella pseudogrignonensis TaxID=419475 RepID=UPI0015C5D560|nr:hypothetical protein [Brucella pseudogrignonensis]
MVARAGTLLIPSGPDENPGMRHLHIVCTDPCAKQKQLVVSVTSWKNDLCDGTCILDGGDHPWVVHKSWVLYRAARLEAASTLDNGIEKGMFEVREVMTAEVFGRVLNGLCASPHTKRGIKKYFGC